MIKQICSWLGLIFLVLTLLALIGLIVWASWETASFLALLLIAWIVLIAVGVWFGHGWQTHKARNWRPEGEPDRRRLEATALELRRLKPESRTASLILDHKPAYERRIHAAEPAHGRQIDAAKIATNAISTEDVQ
jgi:cell division protein FtsL